jgi:hypothetical protein
MEFSPQTLIALVLALVFIGLMALHAAWGLGLRLGEGIFLPQRADGTPLFMPGPAACLGAALLFLLTGGVFLARIGLFVALIPTWVPSVGVWVIAAVTLLRAIGDFRYCGVTKQIRTTEFARMDTLVYTPFCLIISILSVAIQLL